MYAIHRSYRMYFSRIVKSIHPQVIVRAAGAGDNESTISSRSISGAPPSVDDYEDTQRSASLGADEASRPYGNSSLITYSLALQPWQA